MGTLNVANTIRVSNPSGGFSSINLAAIVIDGAGLPLTLSATTPVVCDVRSFPPGSLATHDIFTVNVLDSAADAATYQAAHPSANVGYPV